MPGLFCTNYSCSSFVRIGVALAFFTALIARVDEPAEDERNQNNDSYFHGIKSRLLR